MNENIVLIFVFFICVLFLCEAGKVIEPVIEEYDGLKEAGHFDYGVSQVNSTVYQTVNKYYCSLDSFIEGSHLMVYDTKGWSFPRQNVNLTLRYPIENAESLEEDDSYVITGFRVVLYIDGPSSMGYILNGGVLQDTIILSFVSSELTSLKYEYWLYGARKDTPGIVELNTQFRLC